MGPSPVYELIYINFYDIILKTSMPVSIFILGGILVLLIAVLVWREMHFRHQTRMEHERNMMVALLSHRLRTPLSSIKWHTEMLLNQDFGKLQISQMELLDKV